MHFTNILVAFYEHFSRILRTFNVFLRTFNCRILRTFNDRILRNLVTFYELLTVAFYKHLTGVYVWFGDIKVSFFLLWLWTFLQWTFRSSTRSPLIALSLLALLAACKFVNRAFRAFFFWTLWLDGDFNHERHPS